ncbi:MAG: hypothetical protein AAGF87_16280 [Bacteroidota bacterium]
MSNPTPRYWTIAGRVLVLSVLFLFLAAQLCYLLLDYEALADWYQSLGPFYRQSYWTSEFFTPAVKQSGNRYVALGLVLTTAIIIYVLKSPKPLSIKFREPRANPERKPLAILMLSLTALWVWGSIGLAPAYDELFTTERISTGQLFVASSYYMIPNNHVFFSFLLGLCWRICSFLQIDPLWVGRIISLLSLVGIGGLLFVWLRKVIASPWLRLSSVLLLSSQLGIWGFATQARGYLLLLLFSWLAVCSLEKMLEREKKNPSASLVFVIFSALAFITVPVYLYVFAGIVMYWSFQQIRRKTFNRSAIRILGSTLMLTYLLYLPILAFSGLSALTGNRYVDGLQNNVDLGITGFASDWLPTLPYYFQYALSLWPPEHWILLVLLIALCPIWLYLQGGKRERMLAGLLLCVWISTVLITIFLREVPAARMLLWQLQATFLVFWLAILQVLKRVRFGTVAGIGIALFLALINFKYLPAKFEASLLYYYPVADTHKALQEMVDSLPDQSLVRCSDEAFFPAYLIRKRGLPLDSDSYTHYIRRESESDWPKTIDSFELVLQVQDYLIFEQKE